VATAIEESDQHRYLHYYQNLLVLEDVHCVVLCQDLDPMLTKEEPSPEKMVTSTFVGKNIF
jgi:hypothetical protein